MIIDFHTHMFPDKIAKGTLDFLEAVCKTHPYTDGTSEGLRASTEEAHIKMMDVALTNALDILEGKPCRNIVNENEIRNIDKREGKERKWRKIQQRH